MPRIAVFLVAVSVFPTNSWSEQVIQAPAVETLPQIVLPARPLADALGRAIDPPVCCQLSSGCSPGSEGATPAEVRSLCVAANGQPLTGQYCHNDGACRP